MWTTLVPRKGSEFPWIAKRAARFINHFGHNMNTFSCDKVSAIEALTRESDKLDEKEAKQFQRDRKLEKTLRPMERCFR